MTYRFNSKRRRRCAAFTMVEALLAITIMAMAGSILLLGTSASLEMTKNGMYGAIARGMAQQLMDEIVGSRYCELGTDGYQYPLGPGSDETSRAMYDDSDDYNGLRTKPPKDFYGIALGKDDGLGGQRNSLFQIPAGLIDNWQQEVDVYYVSETNLSTKLAAGQTSDYRVVEVRITANNPGQGTQVLATLKRVLSYVPPMQ
jgi:type II secretory pathway pseudopilin PulG